MIYIVKSWFHIKYTYILINQYKFYFKPSLAILNMLPVEFTYILFDKRIVPKYIFVLFIYSIYWLIYWTQINMLSHTFTFQDNRCKYVVRIILYYRFDCILMIVLPYIDRSVCGDIVLLIYLTCIMFRSITGDIVWSCGRNKALWLAVYK